MTDPLTPHVGDEDIALVIDGAASASERELTLRHLRDCARCREIYEDVAVELSLHGSGSAPAEPDPEISELAHRIPGKRLGNARKHRSPAIGKWGGRIGWLAASVVVLVAAVLWFGGGGQPGDAGLPEDMIAPVRSAVETASGWGSVIIPGGEATSANADIPYRSGFVTLDPSLESALDDIYHQYDSAASLPTARWLAAGYLATGQIDLARDIAADARRQIGKDDDLMIIEGLIAYVDGDLTQAETTLRRVLDRDPSNAVAALDLAVVLHDAGRTNEATELLREILSHPSDDSIKSRAQTLLTSYDSE